MAIFFSTSPDIFDLKNKEQKMEMFLGLPTEIIYGTETCSITAFGEFNTFHHDYIKVTVIIQDELFWYQTLKF